MSSDLNEEIADTIKEASVDDNINSLNKLDLLGKAPVKKGDVLVTSVPFAFVLKNTLRGLHCDTCLRKKQGAQRCSGCASAYYCNRECQKTSWEIHKQECSRLKKLKPNVPPDTARLMARVIFRLKNGGYDHEENVSEKSTRKFKDLMNHYSDVKEDSFRQDHFTSLLVVLNKFLGEENLPNTAELLGIYGRVLVNSFSITDKDLNAVGVGVYLAASIVDHSCNPNAYASFVGTKIFVRSLYDMSELDWKKIRISYIDVLNTTEKRREELQKGYFFKCECAHCRDKEREKIMSSINCGNTYCSYPVHVSEAEPLTSCPRCQFEDFEEGTKEKYLEILHLTQVKLDEMRDKNYFDISKFLIEKQGSLFNKLNLWRVKVLDAAFESAIDVTSWEVAVSYGCENLDGMKFYYGSNHPMYGMCLFKLGKIELYLFRLQEALNHLEEAEPILRVSHGDSHPLYCDDLLPLLRQARQEIKMMQYNGFDVMKSKSRNQEKSILS